MRQRGARILTALVVVTMCGFALSRGSSIVSFAWTRAQVRSHERPAASLRGWATTSGVALAALEGSATEVADPSDVAAAGRRADDISAMLANRPLSSMSWLALAGMRLVAGQPYEKVREALAMSSLTGRNEGHVMLPRAIFGLLQWEALAASARRQVITDLAAPIVQAIMPDGAALTARDVLAAKAAATRQEIAELLRAEGVSPAELARVGL